MSSNKIKLPLQCIVYDENNEVLEYHDCNRNIHNVNGMALESYTCDDCKTHIKEIEEINRNGGI